MRNAFWLENLKGRDHLQDLCIGGKIILHWIGLEDVYWMQLAQDKDQWQSLVNMVMNLQVPLKSGNFLTR
jgi:hypothetical protein